MRWILLKELAQAFTVFSQETFQSFPIAIFFFNRDHGKHLHDFEFTHTHQKFGEKQSDKGSGT